MFIAVKTKLITGFLFAKRAKVVKSRAGTAGYICRELSPKKKETTNYWSWEESYNKISANPQAKIQTKITAALQVELRKLSQVIVWKSMREWEMLTMDPTVQAFNDLASVCSWKINYRNQRTASRYDLLQGRRTLVTQCWDLLLNWSTPGIRVFIWVMWPLGSNDPPSGSCNPEDTWWAIPITSHYMHESIIYWMSSLSCWNQMSVIKTHIRLITVLSEMSIIKKKKGSTVDCSTASAPL